MKFSEAMKALEKGEKVRCTAWDAGAFLLRTVEDRHIQIYQPHPLSDFQDWYPTPHQLVHSWELFEEPPKKKHVCSNEQHDFQDFEFGHSHVEAPHYMQACKHCGILRTNKVSE